MSMLPLDASRSAASTGSGKLAAGAIDSVLDTLEGPLSALGIALRQRDAAALEQQVRALQVALSVVLPRLRQPVRTGDLHAARPRLAATKARLAAQRECVAREIAFCERGLALLMPAPQPTAVYGTHGQAERPATTGSLVA